MIRRLIAFGAGILATCAFAQSNTFGTISGVINDPDGGAVPNIPVQAKNSQTGATQSTSTSASGAYTFAQLLPGTYRLFVPAVGFTLDKFEQKDLVVRAGQTLRAEIKMPGGPLITGPLLYKIVQTPTLFLTLLEDVVALRQVFLDGRGHPKDLNPTWMGHSIGHWEEDTLVIDTVGMNDKSWLNISPHTEQLHLIERYRRTDFAHVQVDITIEDQGAFTKPWTIHSVWNLAPGEEIGEYVCSENNREAQHLSVN